MHAIAHIIIKPQYSPLTTVKTGFLEDYNPAKKITANIVINNALDNSPKSMFELGIDKRERRKILHP